MSREAEAWAWEQVVTPASKKLVLIALARTATATGERAMMTRAMKQRVGLSDGQIRDYLRALRHEGYIAVTAEGGKDGRTPTQYKLGIPKGSEGPGCGDSHIHGADIAVPPMPISNISRSRVNTNPDIERGNMGAVDHSAPSRNAIDRSRLRRGFPGGKPPIDDRPSADKDAADPVDAGMCDVPPSPQVAARIEKLFYIARGSIPEREAAVDRLVTLLARVLSDLERPVDGTADWAPEIAPIFQGRWTLLKYNENPVARAEDEVARNIQAIATTTAGTRVFDASTFRSEYVNIDLERGAIEPTDPAT